MAAEGPTGKELETTTSRLPGGAYSEEEISRGLTAVALYNGNTRRAAEHLEEQGHPIPRSTLKDWTTMHRVEEYERARVFVRDRIWDKMAEEHQAVARNALDATDKATEKGKERLAADDLKGANTAASAARNFATVAGITNDKAAASHGRPTEIGQPLNVADTLRALTRIGLMPPTKDPEPIDAEVVEDGA